MNVSWLFIYFLCALLFGFICFKIYKTVKPMKEPERSKHIMVYSAIFLASIIAVIMIRWIF